MGILRLLVVEGGAPAPISSDVREDWVRAPVTDDDLRARVATLRAKAGAYLLPQVDPNGVLRFSGRSITLSPSETDLLECLVRRFGLLVTREALRDCLPDRPGGASRNALDLHIMRLRRRIRPLGLAIRTVWGRGYLLDSADTRSTTTGIAASEHPRQHADRGRPHPYDDELDVDASRPLVAAEVAALRWAQAHRLAAS
jgi:DNA-binding winged helix-turn-helix (wHTH) protein